MSEEFLRMVSVNLASRGQFELTMAPGADRITILEHWPDGLVKVAEFPPHLIVHLQAFAETYAIHDFRDPVDLNQPIPSTEPPPEGAQRATVERRGQDTIVTPVGLEMGSKTRN